MSRTVKDAGFALLCVNVLCLIIIKICKLGETSNYGLLITFVEICAGTASGGTVVGCYCGRCPELGHPKGDVRQDGFR